MGLCIASIFQYTCISNKMQRYTVYLYLETALHVSAGTSNHHQERIQLHLQHLVFVTPSLLSAAIVEELKPVWVCCGWRTQLSTVAMLHTAATVDSGHVTHCSNCRQWPCYTLQQLSTVAMLNTAATVDSGHVTHCSNCRQWPCYTLQQ
jgi:hypothetical protein